MSDSIIDSAISVADGKAETIEKLVSATEKRLAEAFGEEVPSTPISDLESAVSTLAKSVESVESTPVSNVESAESTISEIESAESVASTVESAVGSKGIPDAYHRAAKHQGWSDEEIKTLYKANPVLAEKTFAKIYDSTNKLSREFAAIGRTKLQMKQEPVKQEPAKQEPVKSEFKKADIEKLRKDYDNDPIVELVASMQDQMEQVYTKLEKQPTATNEIQINERTIRAKIQEEAAVEQQITQFFNGSELKKYKDFYGELPEKAVNWNTLSDSQKNSRWEVLNMADQIMIGAETQGREMSINDALNLAHMSVSEPLREKIIREQIKTKVVKRGKSLTLKPTGKATGAQTGPKTREQLETVTAERLKNVKW